MRYSIAVKFTAVILAALALVVAATGAAGIFLLESNGLYSSTLEDRQKEWYDKAGHYIAWEYACRYAAKHMGSCSDTLLDRLYDEDYYGMASDHWQVALYQDDRRISQTYQDIENPIHREYTFTVEYPVASTKRPDATEPTGEPLDPSTPTVTPLYTTKFTIWENSEMVDYYLSYYESPVYTIQVQMHPNVVQGTPSATVTNMYPYRYNFIGILVAGLVLFAAGLVFLFWSVAETPEREIRPSGLNRTPLDLYALVSGGGIWLLVTLVTDLFAWSQQDGLTPGILTLLALSAYAMALLLIGFLLALTAQLKKRDYFWWKNSALGSFSRKLGQGLGKLFHALHSVFRLLPVIWQWIITATITFLAMGITFILWLSNRNCSHPWIYLCLFLLTVLIYAGVVLYGCYAFGTLLVGAQKLKQGNFNHKIPTKHLKGCFLDFGNHLNALSETALLAAKRHLKAERMKTELITNVSHDIKTPLTSIINFVDLLEKPHTPEEGKQYLGILSRQSERMKRLIEDLIELSKATTGNINVNIAEIDATEAINQALGEFFDRLHSAQLEPVFRQPEQEVLMLADGKLTWRVLSNLLSNAVKYAMPGTRLFIDLLDSEQWVVLSLKNVSREPLKTNAEELMERFVQGDVSRNTEGSGLGLNIAQSLMEVQHGKLHLTLDGDLFKVTLTFPKRS